MNSKVGIVKNYIKNFGLGYTLLSIGTSLAYRISPNSKLAHNLHKKRYAIVTQKLYCKYKNIINDFKKKDINNFSKYKIGDSKYVWVCWWQGIDKAPILVKKCIENIKKRANGKKVIIIDKNNFNRFVDIPSVIIKKVNLGDLSIAFLTDIIRMNLLEKYGGLWIDSTVYITNDLTDFDHYNFFTVKHNLYSNWNIARGKWSGFFIGAGKEDLGIKLIKNILTEYGKSENVIPVYLFIDCIISIAYDSLGTFRYEVNKVPVNNEKVFVMEKQLNNSGDNYKIPASINKLTYKNKHYTKKKGKFTVYKYLISDSL